MNAVNCLLPSVNKIPLAPTKNDGWSVLTVIPNCELHLEIEAVRSHGRVWKYKGTAKVDGKRMADAEWSATIVDRK